MITILNRDKINLKLYETVFGTKTLLKASPLENPIS